MIVESAFLLLKTEPCFLLYALTEVVCNSRVDIARVQDGALFPPTLPI